VNPQKGKHRGYYHGVSTGASYFPTLSLDSPSIALSKFIQVCSAVFVGFVALKQFVVLKSNLSL